MRLKYTASYAKRAGFDAFTSTMLFSVYQNHEQIKLFSENIARECGVRFVYRDYRPLSECSQEIAKKKMLYRQGYCGCVFSEYERYKDTAREVYKGSGAAVKDKDIVAKVMTGKDALQRCDCFG